ncbi:MAG TPA: carboxyl transferase domain-containing protein [Solirubrobacteraceae bacterium]|nr:carboxyl transferase domain-containing protein [Solirubrobacteraceae bacterium]
MDEEETDDALAEFHRRREAIRGELGGVQRIARLHARGELTVREHIDGLLDAGSFDEVGTFARSARPEDFESTPGDGKVGGHGLIDGRAVTVAGDDITVKRGSSSVIGSKRVQTLFAHAARCGHPIVYFGATGGARIPDTLGSAGFSQVPPGAELFRRGRRIPMVTVIVGDSFGGSSFFSAASDLVVQLRGTCLAVTSPLVVEVATGETVAMEELGGTQIHARKTGQIDLAVDAPAEAYAQVRRFLSYLPPNAWTRAQRTEAAGAGSLEAASGMSRPSSGPGSGSGSGSAPGSTGSLEPDPELGALVPARRSRAYDMRRVLRRVLDPESLFELAPEFGRGLISGLGRVDGHAVGVVASQPKFFAGALDPDACEKAVRLICMCDAFDIPILFFQDVPGFFVGKQVEHDGMLKHAIRLQTALALAQTPKLTMLLRKSYGLAYFSLGGNDTGVDAVYSWPGAEISFMDPSVAANVVLGDQLEQLPEDERGARRAEVVQAITADTDPYGAAGLLKIDEIIDPADTRGVLARALGRLEGRARNDHQPRPLASWPTR